MIAFPQVELYMAELYNKVGFFYYYSGNHFHSLTRIVSTFSFLFLLTSLSLFYQTFRFHFLGSLNIIFTFLSDFSLSLSCFSYCCFHFPGWHWSDHLVPHLPWTLLRQVERCWSLWQWRQWQWCWWGICCGGCPELTVIDGDIIINSGKPDDQAALFTKLALKSGK